MLLYLIMKVVEYHLSETKEECANNEKQVLFSLLRSITRCYIVSCAVTESELTQLVFHFFTASYLIIISTARVTDILFQLHLHMPSEVQ